MSLSKYLLLIPLRYNDGELIPQEVVEELEHELFTLGNGYTIGGLRKGAYKMADGQKVIDETVEYWVVIPDDKFEELRQLMAELGRQLGQEAMYLEKTGSQVYFVLPSVDREQGEDK